METKSNIRMAGMKSYSEKNLETRQFEEILEEYSDPKRIRQLKFKKNREEYGKEFL